jgi:alcohol dehydrogenase
MSTRVFRLAGEIVYGSGSSGSLPEVLSRLGATRVAIVTDRGIDAAGILAPFESAIREAGYPLVVIADTSPNPRDTEVVEAARTIADHGADAIAAIGGGSPIDLAKAASGIASNGGRVQDWLPPRTFEKPPVPIVAIPTTAGTGSEVTRSSVINDTERAIKVSLRDVQIAPKAALVDPDLTVTLPPSLTAATGMDALTHAVEAYTGRLANPISDALALNAIERIARYLPTAVRDGEDRAARYEMMMASVIAGMAFSNADVAAVHCIAEAIGGRYDTPHGVANSLFLPYLFAFNASADPQRHADVAVAMGAATPGEPVNEAARRGSEALARLAREIGIPTFREIPGIRPDEFPWIAAASAANLSNASNAREIGEDDYLAILDQAWHA